MDGEYIIVGDTEVYDGCLVCVCTSFEQAEQVLNRMINNPTASDKKMIKGHKNLRIEKMNKEYCWWND